MRNQRSSFDRRSRAVKDTRFSQAKKQKGDFLGSFESTQRESRRDNQTNRERPRRSSFSRQEFTNSNSFGSNRNSNNHFRRDQNTRRRGSRGGSRRKRGPKLDANLFVKKADENAIDIQHPISHKFADFKLVQQLQRNLDAKNYQVPTPIQDQAIPHIINGKNVLGLANTGTGKTGAFLIPLINKLNEQKSEKVIVIVPTRELAVQVNTELREFSKGMNLFSVLCVGASNIHSQIHSIKKGFNFIIGTPGRLKDLLDRKALDLSKFNTVVLDEVDRMLDMGFIDDIKYILSHLPKERQSLFFSATISREVELIIHEYLGEYMRVSVKTGNTADRIDQDVIRTDSYENKLSKLEDILKEHSNDKVIVFARTKREVDRLDKYLYQKRFKVSSIHGDKRQSFRYKSLDRFKNGVANILVATDVAARGLDIPNVALVINFDQPENYDDYVHRIGRTGRANKTGKALTFVGDNHSSEEKFTLRENKFNRESRFDNQSKFASAKKYRRY